MAVENGMYVGKKKEKKKIEIPFADKVYNELLCLTDTLK